jgi:hypothetical protein
MSEEKKDYTHDDPELFGYDRQKHITENLLGWGKVLCVFALAVALGCGAWGAVEWAKFSASQRKLSEEKISPAVERIVGKVESRVDDLGVTVDRLNRIGLNLERTTGQLELGVKETRTVHIPRIITDLSNTQAVIRTAVAKLGDETTRQIKQNGDSVNSILDRIDGEAASSLPLLTAKLIEAAEDLRESGKRVRVLVEDAGVERDLRDTLASLRGSSANLEVITGHVSSISANADKKFDALVNPKKPSGFWGKTKYALSVLKDVGGVVYLVLRTAALF